MTRQNECVAPLQERGDLVRGLWSDPDGSLLEPARADLAGNIQIPRRRTTHDETPIPSVRRNSRPRVEQLDVSFGANRLPQRHHDAETWVAQLGGEPSARASRGLIICRAKTLVVDPTINDAPIVTPALEPLVGIARQAARARDR